MQTVIHKRKQGTKRKKFGRANKRKSYRVTLTLPEPLGDVVKALMEESGATASAICTTAIARGLSGRGARSLDQRIAEIAQAHRRLVDEREGKLEPKVEPVIRRGEGLGAAIDRMASS